MSWCCRRDAGAPRLAFEAAGGAAADGRVWVVVVPVRVEGTFGCGSRGSCGRMVVVIILTRSRSDWVGLGFGQGRRKNAE